jgi:hypothetical protein
MDGDRNSETCSSKLKVKDLLTFEEDFERKRGHRQTPGRVKIHAVAFGHFS